MTFPAFLTQDYRAHIVQNSPISRSRVTLLLCPLLRPVMSSPPPHLIFHAYSISYSAVWPSLQIAPSGKREVGHGGLKPERHSHCIRLRLLSDNRYCKSALFSGIMRGFSVIHVSRDKRKIMTWAIINPLMYLSMVIYLAYILVEGWSRLPGWF